MQQIAEFFLKEWIFWMLVVAAGWFAGHEYMKSRSFGKVLGIIFLGIVIGVFVQNPQEFFTKVGEGIKWALNTIRFGG